MLKKLLLTLFLVSSALATVTSTETKRQYFTCNGSTTNFTFTAPCNSSDDIKVYERLISTGVETLLTEDIEYTITNTGSNYLEGGVVTMGTAPASTYQLVIVREIVQTQETASGAITPISVVAALDKLTREIQDIRYDLNYRYLRIPQTDVDTLDMEYPNSISRASKNFTWDSDGNPTATSQLNTGSANISTWGETIIDDATAAVARTTLEITSANVMGTINVKDPPYNAVGDGVTDDTVAIQAAIDAASAAYIGIVKFPKGNFRITDTIYIPSYVTLVGQSGGGWLYPYSDDATHIYADLTDTSKFAISSDIIVVATGLRYDPQSFPTGTNYDDGDCTKANGIGIENLVLYTDKAIFGGIKIMASPNAKIRNVTSEGFKIGIFVSSSWSIVLDPIFIRAGWQGLVLQYTVNGGTISGLINLYGTTVMMAEDEIPDWNFLTERGTDRHPTDYPRKRTGIYTVYVGPNNFTNIVLSGWDIAIQSFSERTSTYGSLGTENISEVVLFPYYSQLMINNWSLYVDGTDLIYPGQTVNLVVGNIFEGPGRTLGNFIADLHAQVNSSITFLGPGYNTDGTATGYKTPNLIHHTTNAIVECIHNSTHTNLAAGGNITLTLSSYPIPGTIYHFSVQDAFELRIDPGTNAILDSSGVTDDKYKTANAVGECLTIMADDNLDWVVISKYGTWTEE